MSLHPGVFVNRTLNMKRINYIGLDMDHTLIRYKTSNFEKLAHNVMLKKLVEQLDYPESVLKLKFDYSRAIRGLVIDKNKGNVIKLSRHAAIRASYHGLNRIDYKKQKTLYKSTYIDLGDSNYDPVDTSFSISFATLFAQLVDLKDHSESQTLPDYATMATDLAVVLDQAHRDGSIKDVIRNNIEDYIIKDQEIVDGLERFKKHGKKVFIATNSDYAYTKLLLDYAITPLLKEHDHWRDVFEFTITLAQKPKFFTDNTPFLKVNPDDGSMTNVTGKVEPGGIYQGGCANRLTADLNLDADEILYIGDHIYGDILRLKKDCAWRTALVVEELREEIDQFQKAQKTTEKINALMAKKVPIERKLDDLISDQIENEHQDHKDEIKKLTEDIQEIDKSLSPLIKEHDQFFNPYWGEVFRAGIEESYFAYQVERFACIYMASLGDLFKQNPRTYFRSHRKSMAHEV